MKRFTFCYFTSLLLLLGMPNSATAQLPNVFQDGDTLRLIRPLLKIKWVPPGNIQSQEVKAAFGDSSFTFKGSDFEFRITEKGYIESPDANFEYEGKTLAAICGEGRALGESDFVRAFTGATGNLNQEPVIFNGYQACLITMYTKDPNQDLADAAFSASLMMPFYHLDIYGTLRNREALLRSLYSFELYHVHPRLLLPSNQESPDELIGMLKDFIEKPLKDVIDTDVVMSREDPQSSGLETYRDTHENAVVLVMDYYNPDDDDGAYNPEGLTFTINVQGEHYPSKKVFFADPGEEVAVNYQASAQPSEVDLTLEVPPLPGDDSPYPDAADYVAIDRFEDLIDPNYGYNLFFDQSYQPQDYPLPGSGRSGPSPTLSLAWQHSPHPIRVLDENDKVEPVSSLHLLMGSCVLAHPDLLPAQNLNDLAEVMGMLSKGIDRLDRDVRRAKADNNLPALYWEARSGSELFRERMDEIRSIITPLVRRLEPLEQEFQAEIEGYEAILKEIDQGLASCGSAASEQKEEQIRQLSTQLRALKGKLNVARYDRDGYIKALEAFLKQPGSFKGTSEELAKELADAEAEMLRIEQDGLFKNYDIQISQLEEKIRKTNTTISILSDKEEIAAEQAKVKSLIEQRNFWIQKRNEKYPTYERLTAQAQQYRAQLPKLKQVEAMKKGYDAYQALAIQIDELAVQIAGLQLDQTACQHFVKSLNEERPYIESLIEETTAARRIALNQLKTLKGYLKQLQTGRNTLDAIPKIFEKDTEMNRLGVMGSSQVQCIRYGARNTALKSMLKKYTSVEYWEISDQDMERIAMAYAKGVLDAMNPQQWIEILEYCAYIGFLYEKDLLKGTTLARDELVNSLGMVEEAAKAFLTANLAEQGVILAGFIGNAKGEVLLGAALIKAGKPSYEILKDLNKNSPEIINLNPKAQAMKEALQKGSRALADIFRKRITQRSKSPVSISGQNIRVARRAIRNYWQKQYAAFKAEVDRLVADEVIEKQAANDLLQAIGPSEYRLLYNANPQVAQRALERLMRRLDNLKGQGKQTGYWADFNALLQADPDLAYNLDLYRDRLLYQVNAEVHRRFPHSAAGYSGSVVGYTPEKVDRDYKKLTSDRDWLFLGTDGAAAAAYYRELMQQRFGDDWGQMFDVDVYVDPKWDDLGALGITADNIKDAGFRARAEAIVMKWQNEARDEVARRTKAWQAEQDIETKKLSAAEVNQYYKDASTGLRTWKNASNAEEALAGLDQWCANVYETLKASKDGYLTPGGRRSEIANRMMEYISRGIDDGPSWQTYIKTRLAGNMPADYQQIELLDNAFAIDGIRDNMAQVWNKRRKLGKNSFSIVQKCSRYYERAISKGIEAEAQVNLLKLKPAGGLNCGKSVEDVRHAAMMIKEGKRLSVTRRELTILFDIAEPDKLSTGQWNRYYDQFIADMETSVELVKNAIPTDE